MKKIFGNKREAARLAVSSGLSPILPRLWRFAYSLSGSADMADELLQETCLRAIDKATQYKQGTRLDSWTFTICRNHWLNTLRKRKVRFGTGINPVEDVDLPCPAPSTEMNIFASQVVEHVMGLPGAQRETVFLVYIEGFSYKEASQILDIPIGTIMSRLATARQNLAHLNDETLDIKATDI